MPDEHTKPIPVENFPSFAGGISAIASANAPFVYFEGVPFYALLHGVGKIVLTSSRHIANAPAGSVLADHVIVGHLVGNLSAIRALRVALDGILLMAEQKPERPTN